MDFKCVLRSNKPLERMCKYFNMETELRKWKHVNRERRTWTKEVRKYYMRLESLGIATATKEAWLGGMDKVPDFTPYKSDLMPIKLTKVSVQYDHSELIISDCSISTPQGTFVSVFGPPGCGKKALLNLVAHKIFPVSGDV